MNNVHLPTVGEGDSIGSIPGYGKGDWRIPAILLEGESIPNKRANKYLRHQRQRLLNSVVKGDYEKSYRIFMFLAQNSISYRVY